jgi:hypothetical protein
MVPRQGEGYEVYDLASPVTHVEAGSPVTLLFRRRAGHCLSTERLNLLRRSAQHLGIWLALPFRQCDSSRTQSCGCRCRQRLASRTKSAV